MVGIHLESSVSVPILVVGMKTEPSSSDVWMDVSPRFMKFGLSVRTASLLKFIGQCELTSELYSSVSLRPITLLKMAAGYLRSD